MNKIKIVHFVNGMNNGGVEAVILNYFSNIDRSNYDLHIVTQGDNDDKCVRKFKNLGFKVHVVTRKKESLIKNLREIYKILKEEKFDILHTHMTVTNVFPLMLGWLAGVKVRINHSHLAIKDMGIMDKIYCKLSLLFTTHKFACGREAAKTLFKNMEDVIILKNAIDLEKFQYNDEIRKEMRRELNINNELVLCNIGRLTAQKNQMFLIEIMNQLVKHDQNVKLLIIGFGELEQQLKQKVAEYNLADKISFLGTRDDIEKIYQCSDIFVLPSLKEGLPLVCIESQTSGLKTIVSDNVTDEVEITPIIKYLPITDTELWVKEILDLKEDYERKDYKEEIRKNGYDIKLEAKRLDDLYRKMLEEKK